MSYFPLMVSAAILCLLCNLNTLSLEYNHDTSQLCRTGHENVSHTRMITLVFLFYPITLEGCWGTTDEFATIPFHFVLFSAALVELAKSIPVHSLILSSHLFFCLPNHLSFHFLTRARSLSYSPLAAWIFL